MSTSEQPKRVHYYHAEASALGGRLDEPLRQIIPVQAPLSLPVVGGYASARAEKFRIEGILSFEAAYTQVSGSSKSKNGPWSALVTSVVEGLNILDIFTADRIVAQIASEHPAQGYFPRITFAGTQFQNVRIAGIPVTVDLELDICQQNNGPNGFPTESCVLDKSFLERVARQYAVVSGQDNPASVPEWAKERYRWDVNKKGKDFVVCSVVKGISGKFPGSSFGNVLQIPQFGTGFLGELIVADGSYRLIMFRFELGCANHGSFSGGYGVLNGSTDP